ncbi:MAG: hypothetical protein NWF01_04565 [Candidatus Bathyarchaeota archaeon]|nr:hypothetical protein [Candidatus Bathyarchaeota archaeon]
MVKADGASITVDPDSASEDTLVTLNGTGFGSDATVTIELGDYFVNTTITDSDGAFNMTFTVKDTWDPDDYELIAVQSDSGTNATVDFTVTDAQATSTPTVTLSPQETGNPYIDEPTILTETDNTGTTVAIVAAVLAAILIPVTLLYFRGSIGGRGKRRRGYDDGLDPYYPQDPYGYGGSGGQGYYQQYQPYQQPSSYPSLYQGQRYSRPYGGSQYGQPAGYSYGGSSYGGYSRGSYTTQYSSGGQSSRGTKICPNCRQVVRTGTYSCPYCNTRLM